MKKEIFQSNYNNLVGKELANRIIIVIFAFVIGIEGFVIKDLIGNQRTIISPCGNTVKEFWVTGNRVSQTYLEQQGKYISQTLLTTNPKNAKKQFLSILPLVESSQYNDIKNELLKQASYLIENDISTVFYTGTPEYKDNKIIMNGVKNNTIGNKTVTSKKIKFTIGFKIENGRFYILRLKVD